MKSQCMVIGNPKIVKKKFSIVIHLAKLLGLHGPMRRNEKKTVGQLKIKMGGFDFLFMIFSKYFFGDL